MRNWENVYKVCVTYKRGTESIYRIYFRERNKALAWLVTHSYYKIKEVQQS